MLAIPDVDRGRCELPNLTAVVLAEREGGYYKLRCRSGILDSYYSRNQFAPTTEKMLQTAAVPQDKTVSLRQAAGLESMGGTQGFFKCNCTGKCITKQCKCVRENRKCNSRCHSRRSCSNID